MCQSPTHLEVRGRLSAIGLQDHFQLVGPVPEQVVVVLPAHAEAVGFVEAPGVGVVAFDAQRELLRRWETFEAGEEQTGPDAAALPLGEHVDGGQDDRGFGSGVPVGEANDLTLPRRHEEGAGGDPAPQGFFGVGLAHELGSRSLRDDVFVDVRPVRPGYLPDLRDRCRILDLNSSIVQFLQQC